MPLNKKARTVSDQAERALHITKTFGRPAAATYLRKRGRSIEFALYLLAGGAVAVERFLERNGRE